MDGGVNNDDVRPLGLQSINGSLSPMRGAIIHNPKNAPSRTVRLLGHDLLNETIKSNNSGCPLAMTENLRPTYIPRSKICPGTVTLVLMFNEHRAARGRWQCWMNPAATLYAGLFIGGKNIVIFLEILAFPLTGLEIQNPSGSLFKFRISWKDPSSMCPRADGVFVKPSPNCRVADGGNQATSNGLSMNF